MSRWTWIATVVIGASWTLLLLPWVRVSDASLSGAELSDLLALLPGLSVLMLLIALYGRGAKVLHTMSAATLLVSAFIAFSTDFRTSPASIQVQESLSGLAGDAGLATQTIAPTFFGLSQGFAAALCLFLLTRKPGVKSENFSSDETDPRGIWESQS